LGIAFAVLAGCGDDAAPETFTFANTPWWAMDEGAGWGGPTYSGGLPADVDSVIQQDPLLEGDDYVPAAASPALGAGQRLPFAPVPGVAFRGFEDRPSIGAHEIAE